MLREISEADLGNLTQVIHREQWSDFRSCIAHHYNEAQELNKALAETEQALRNTFGYGSLLAGNPQDRRRAAALLLLRSGPRASRSDQKLTRRLWEMHRFPECCGNHGFNVEQNVIENGHAQT
ncbi:MAG: hypothetical protein MUE94_06875 [Verrucomicrobia bacterium]|jgi:hypothetical protein|nr:hypothetical protein [Verrucomicrobiota bacterium]